MSLGISEPRFAGLSQWLAAAGRLQVLPTVLGLGILTLAGLAALEGQLVALNARAVDPRPWLIGAAMLGLVGVRLLERGDTVDEPTRPEVVLEPWRLTGRRQLLGAVLLTLGGLGSLAASALVFERSSDAAVTPIWVASLLAATAGCLLVMRRRMDVPSRKLRLPRLELLVLAVVLGMAAWLRLPDLARVPANVHGDEASIGLEARRILTGSLSPVFATGWYDVPSLSFALHAAVMRVFGNDLFGLRLGSAIEGLLSIVVLYLLARRLWGARPALVAAALMAIAAWHVHFSRTGFQYMQAPLALLLTLYFLVLGIEERRAVYWLLAGFGIGLSIEVYYAARLVAPIVAVYLGYCALRQRGLLSTHAPGLAALGFGALVFLAPMLTAPPNLAHELDAYHVTTLQDVLALQVRNTLEAFNMRGETSLQYGHPTPLLDPWTGGLLAMSALAALFRLGSARGVLLATWVWSALIVGSVLTLDALFSPRVLIALPALVLGPALVLEQAWRGLTRVAGHAGTYVFGASVIALLALALVANVDDYFNVQVVRRQPADRFT
ncbi:MAG: glycosyltransferase family 39 protein, partial [Chloroflexi bacterium]